MRLFIGGTANRNTDSVKRTAIDQSLPSRVRYFKAWQQSLERCRSLFSSQATSMKICWNIIMVFLPNNTKKWLPNPPLIIHISDTKCRTYVKQAVIYQRIGGQTSQKSMLVCILHNMSRCSISWFYSWPISFETVCNVT